jgi:ELWxxDGT repeat protein
VNGLLFFRADDGVAGRELWKSDGTEAGATRVRDIWPGSGWSFPAELVGMNGTLFFRANDGVAGAELWRSDGTEAGTVRVKDIRPGPVGSLPDPFGDFVANLTPRPRPSPSAREGGTLFFAADDGVAGVELWKSDGTEEGTVLVKDIAPGGASSLPRGLRAVEGGVVFQACDARGCEVWTSDGTEAGTRRVADVEPGPTSSNPFAFTPSGTLVFFGARTAATGHELWALPRIALFDADGDGVASPADLCPDSPRREPVNAEGCTAEELVALRCPREEFSRHGRYVSCVAHAAQEAVREGLIRPAEKARLVKQAAQEK